MADLSDVTGALVDLIVATLYPNTINAPSTIGNGVKIYEGWPAPDVLDVDLGADPAILHVTVYPRPEELDTTRGLGGNWVEVAVGPDSGTSVKEVGRQKQLVQIDLWAPTPDLRTVLSRAIDPVLKNTPRIFLADGSVGAVEYRNSAVDDFAQRAAVYRKALFYWVEYPTLLTSTEYVVKQTTTVVKNMPETVTIVTVVS